jgi:soluble lytic murein transglycosylase-like protein
LERSVSRDRVWAFIGTCAAELDVDPGLVGAVIQRESGFNPASRSCSGASGLMQLMPSVCSTYGVTNPFDVYQNIRAGTALLATNLKRYAGDVDRALAAYNIGPRHVDDGSWLRNSKCIRYVRSIEGLLPSFQARFAQ